MVACDFSSKQVITDALTPFLPTLRGVICRGDHHIQYLRQVIPVLPPGVPVADERSLAAATNKQLMRAAFTRHSPEITPAFMQVHDASEATIQRIEAHMAYPVIVKPTQLASSLLIQSCYSHSELETVLRNIFNHIRSVYEKEDSRGQPEVIVEEYMEGDFYSIDAYVGETGDVYYCPPVGYVSAKQIGIDDFFLYKRFLPAALAGADVQAANEVVYKAVKGVGLTHSTVHAELVRTKNGWRIIEIGPRIGRFRHTMYSQGYGIDHSLNDMKLHVGIAPDISTDFKRYCSAYSVYPEREGVLQRLAGWQELVQQREVVWSSLKAVPGDPCTFAKHGGHALAEFVIATDDKQRFQALTAWAERTVHAVVE
jgi:biotin carboxylase